MKTLSRIAVPLLALWLLAWIVVSWGGIQDDALIHLRYADFLHRLHFITYDGIHASYGTSSLLYVGLLAVLRGFSTSPYLSRAVSTFFHLILFTAFAALYLRTTRRDSPRVQLLAFAVLLTLSFPSAVRWLDDGMETGLVLCLISLAVWWTHRLSLRLQSTSAEQALSVVLGFLLVILRNELAIVAFFAALILTLIDAGKPGPQWLRRVLRALPTRIAILAGAVLAALSIRLVMHSFLPDTALAKSHGIAFFPSTLFQAELVLAGALFFGIGTLLLWLLSAAIVLREQASSRRLANLAANLLFPFVLLLSALRGQEIQGVRYLVWTFVFAIVWNLLELRSVDAQTRQEVNPRNRLALIALSAFVVLCLFFLPLETRLMRRVLTTRAATMKLFIAQDLAGALPNQLGIATDIGYISYYTHDNICDSAGLVNGRAAAAMSEADRARHCIAQHPGFVFVNSSQANTLAQFMDFSTWPICGSYDFANLRIPDRHYLLVRPDLAPTACQILGNSPTPPSTVLLPTSYP